MNLTKLSDVKSKDLNTQDKMEYDELYRIIHIYEDSSFNSKALTYYLFSVIQ